jgi:hypothetical protein
MNNLIGPVTFGTQININIPINYVLNNVHMLTVTNMKPCKTLKLYSTNAT